MNLLQQTKQFCRTYNIKPARSKGQNFLIREDVYKKIIETEDLNKGDTVLEVGPGLGFMAEIIARKAKKVIAVELDDKLAEALRVKLQKKGIGNVKIINDDIISGSTASGVVGPLKKYKVVANLPFNITSRFLRMFLGEVKHKPETLVLLLQKEVAERIIAKPGQMSLLAVSVQFYANVQIVETVSKEAFWPKPKVDSTIVRLKVKSKKLNVDEEKFFKLVKIGFGAKRKQLQGNLAKGLGVESNKIKKILKDCGLNERVRAQELSVDNWHKLYVVLNRQKMV